MKLTKRLNYKFVPISDPGYGGRFPVPQIINGRIVGIADNKHNYISKAYSINDMVYAVVNIVLDKIRMAPWGVYKVVSEQDKKIYDAFMSRKDLSGLDFIQAMKLRSKALEPVTTNSKLTELLKWANESETFSDLVANGCGYEMLTGDHFMWALLLGAGANSGLPQELYNLPSQDITIIANTGFPVKELGYSINTFNLNFKKSQVMHRKKWDPSTWGANDQLFGMSPLKAALSTIARANAAVTAGASAFDNMGIAGVLFVDNPNMTDSNAETAMAQALATKEVLYNEYSGPENKGKIAVSGYKMGWQNIGLSPVDLNIIESQMWDLRMICNIYGVPSQLLNDPDNKTYANQKEGESALTSRCAIPQLNSFREHFNKKLQTDWGFKAQNIVVDYDPNVFTELRQNTKEVAEWSGMVKMITANEQRELLGMDARKEPEADELIFNGQLLTEHQQNVLDTQLNNEFARGEMDKDTED